MSKIQRALTLASMLLVAFLSSVTTAHAQSVTLNGNPVDPGGVTTVSPGDVIEIKNDTGETVTITDGAGNEIEIKPGGKATIIVQDGGVGPIKIEGADGNIWIFELDPGMPRRG